MDIFGIKTKIYMGEDSIKCLNEVSGKRCYIICDPFLVESDKVNIITKLLCEKNIDYKIFSQVVPDPTLEVVSSASCDISSYNPDIIIAFGGGSAIDTAKSVKLVYSKINKNEVKFIAIPTASGTGSEVTSFSVISDSDTSSKFPIVNDDMLPDFAILDSQFTSSVPAEITANTGMDVLTHALEALVSSKANDFSDAYSIMAVKLVFKYLEKAVKNGNDMEARNHLHNASCMAGIAFNSASLGICHSLAHALGGYFHVPHGKSNAMILPHVIEYNSGILKNDYCCALKKYANLSREIGIGSGGDVSSAKALIRYIKNLMRKIGVPYHINSIINIEEYEDALDFMARKALIDKCTETNPIEVSYDDLICIYRKLILKKRV